FGFEIREDKVQLSCSWTYLGFWLHEQTIVPQQLITKDNPKTLHNLQQLCGSICWVHPLLGITTQDLAPLFNLLRGSNNLTPPRTIMPEAQESIVKVQEALSSQQAHQFEPSPPFLFAILGKTPHLYALLFQWDSSLKDPLLILEWVFLPNQQTKPITTPQELMASLIHRGRTRLHSFAGCDFTCIYMPLATTEELEHLLQNNERLQFALDSFPGKISIHLPGHKFFISTFNLVPKFRLSKTPLKAVTVFTDGSGSSHKSVMTQKWESDIQVVEGSPQIAELAAIMRAFVKFQQLFNLVTDSA
ncbi:POK8 protein, partial [Hippolais icterina]|nr:POK8 protein [Hippolais icterina]